MRFVLLRSNPVKMLAVLLELGKPVAHFTSSTERRAANVCFGSWAQTWKARRRRFRVRSSGAQRLNVGTGSGHNRAAATSHAFIRIHKCQEDQWPPRVFNEDELDGGQGPSDWLAEEQAAE